MNKKQSKNGKSLPKLRMNLGVKIAVIIIAVIVGLIVLAVIAIIIFNHVSVSNEKQKFTDISSAVQVEGPLLAQSAPDLQNWSFTPSCKLVSGVDGFSFSSWECTASWTGTLSLSNIDEVKAMAAKLKQSSLFTLRGENNYSKLQDQSNNAQIQHPSYSVQVYETKTHETCSEDFVNTQTDIDVDFGCIDGATQSWYPNTETDQYLHGVNAYKE